MVADKSNKNPIIHCLHYMGGLFRIVYTGGCILSIPRGSVYPPRSGLVNFHPTKINTPPQLSFLRLTYIPIQEPQNKIPPFETLRSFFKLSSKQSVHSNCTLYKISNLTFILKNRLIALNNLTHLLLTKMVDHKSVLSKIPLSPARPTK